MLLKTFLAPKVIHLPRINFGVRRGNYLGGAFQVIPYPEAEDVFFIQKSCPNFPLVLQPFLAAGVVRACAASLSSGKRICGVALLPDLLKYHDVDTTEEGLERCAFHLIQYQLWTHAV